MTNPQLHVPVSEHDHAQGLANAPVTLVEYGDYECPACGEAYPIVKRIQRQMGDGLRFVFRNFPLAQMHPHAEHAAEAAEAAAAQQPSGRSTIPCTSIKTRSGRCVTERCSAH